jgi:GGDEF domain-containing protein
LGGDDFIIISNTPDIEALCQRIIKNFDQAVPGFYEKDDLLRGSIVTKNRKGQQESFPLISLAIGVATNKSRPLCSVGEVATTGSELKCFAKKFPGSYFAIEKRKEAYPAPLQSK